MWIQLLLGECFKLQKEIQTHMQNMELKEDRLEVVGSTGKGSAIKYCGYPDGDTEI